MITKEIVAYVKAELARGTAYELLKSNIIKTGWTESDFNEVMREIHAEEEKPAQAAPVAQVQREPSVQPNAQPHMETRTYTETRTVSQAPISTPHIQSEPIVHVESLPKQQPTIEPVREPVRVTQPAVAPIQQVVYEKPVYVAPIVKEPMPQFTPSVQATPVTQTTQTTSVSTQTVTVESRKPIIPYSSGQSQIAEEVPRTNTKKKVAVVAGSIIGILLIASLGFYGYASGYFGSLDNVTLKALSGVHDAKTVKIDMSMTVDVSEIKKQMDQASLGQPNPLLPDFGNTMTITSTGSTDASDEKNPKFSNSITFVTGGINGAVDMRARDGMYYMRMTKAPNLGIISLAPFENKWLSFSTKDTGGSSLPSLAPSPLASTSAFGELTDTQKKHIEELAKNAHLITITKKLSPQIVDGSLSYHFMFDIDRAGMKAYLKEVFSYLKQSNPNNPAFADIPGGDISVVVDYIKTFNGEVWVGVFDNLPHKFAFDSSFGDPKDPTSPTIKINGVASMSEWNKPVMVEIPTDSVPFETFISGLFGADVMGPSPEALTMSADSQKKSTLANMRVQAELFYDMNNNSYKGVCSSPKQGLSAMAQSLPAGTDYKCKDSGTGWIAWAKLSTGKYRCVDATGRDEDIGILPNGLQCR